MLSELLPVRAGPMELRQLRHFLEVVRSASFGKAAEKLHLTQPALSKSIKNLEESLGVQLLERYPKGVEPTEYGAILVEYAAMAQAELDRALTAIEDLRGHGKHTVRVGTGSTLLGRLLPGAVRRFRAVNAGTTVLIREGLKEYLTPMLMRGELDIMITSVEGKPKGQDVACERVLTDELVIVADQAHPLVGQESVPLTRLLDFDWVLPEPTEAERDRLSQAFVSEGLDPPRAAVRTASSIFMASFLKGTEFLSYLPLGLVGVAGVYGNLAVVNGPPIWPEINVAVSYRRTGVMLVSTRQFIDCVRETGSELTEGT